MKTGTGYWESNFHADTGRQYTALDGSEEPLLAMLEQITDRGDVIGGVKSISARMSVLV